MMMMMMMMMREREREREREFYLQNTCLNFLRSNFHQNHVFTCVCHKQFSQVVANDRYLSQTNFTIHYDNKPMQLNAVFHDCMNSIFQMETCSFLLFILLPKIVGACNNRLNGAVLANTHNLCSWQN